MRQLRSWVYWQLFPGMNLHARERFARLPRHFGNGCVMLDAGCGNGMLAYRSFQKRGTVVGISIKESEVHKASELFNRYLRIPEDRLRFQEMNLYDLRFEDSSFGEIICTEVLEHLNRDSEVCGELYRLLRPGGVLHVCAPNAAHPYNKAFPLDRNESGGHVRPGYTEESFRDLLKPLGFEIEMVEGLGGPVRQAFNSRIKEVQRRFGAVAGLPLFLMALLALPFEQGPTSTASSFSIYVKARKPRKAG